jgi:hypothetical protein
MWLGRHIACPTASRNAVIRHLILDDLLFLGCHACGQVHVRNYGLLEAALT